MHEQSETIQDKLGRWTNVFGRDTANAGSPLPGMSRYSKLPDATSAAERRSQSSADIEAPLQIQRHWERSYAPPVEEKLMAGGLSSYRGQGMNPEQQDNAGIDAMLQNIDSGAAAPGSMGETRGAMPQPAAQGNNPWLQWLMQYLQSKQGPGAPQGQPR